MGKSNQPLGLRILLAATFILFAAAASQIAGQAVERSELLASRRWLATLGLAVGAAILILGVLAATWAAEWPRLARRFEAGLSSLQRLRRFNLLLFALAVIAFALLVLGPPGEAVRGLAVRLSLFWLVALAGAVFLKAASPSRSWPETLALSWLLSGVGYRVAAFLPDVSTYPFSLSWSEASRYYYASLFFAQRIYGVDAPPSVLHPSRYLMQAIPFLIPSLPLWFHRLWQVLLWLALPVLTVYLLHRRNVGQVSIPADGSGGYGKLGGYGKPPYGLLFVAWAFLFLFQGPMYYHLLVCVVIVLWGFDSRKFWRSLGVVALASAWAGISRINWFPMPGLLAASLYFLASPTPLPLLAAQRQGREGDRGVGGIFLKPLTWLFAGTLTAFGAQALYVLWSGVEAEQFASSFTSDLLWYRLLPNPTFPLGILPTILLVSVPLLVLTLPKLRGLHPLRWLGLGAILSVLFVGGVVVSAKIGGGSNLHNLDAFLVMLLVVASHAFFGRADRDNFQYKGLVALALLTPVVFAVSAGGPVSRPERQQAERTLIELREMAQTAARQGGEVLFISQRHLLTFGLIRDVPLVDDYENVFLMEMAMAGNQAYLDRFYEDVRNHRFALIVSFPVRENLKGSEYSFGEENDAWVRGVSRPLLDFYERKAFYKRLGIEVLAPK